MGQEQDISQEEIEEEQEVIIDQEATKIIK